MNEPVNSRAQDGADVGCSALLGGVESDPEEYWQAVTICGYGSVPRGQSPEFYRAHLSQWRQQKNAESVIQREAHRQALERVNSKGQAQAEDRNAAAQRNDHRLFLDSADGGASRIILRLFPAIEQRLMSAYASRLTTQAQRPGDGDVENATGTTPPGSLERDVRD